MIRTFGLVVLWGAGHFISAIPGGTALGLSAPVASLAALLGYAAIAALMLAVGASARAGIIRRFKINIRPDPSRLFWRAWQKGGLVGLGLLAPFTCGPWIAVLIALALGERGPRTLLVICLTAIPTALVLLSITIAGISAISR